MLDIGYWCVCDICLFPARPFHLPVSLATRTSAALLKIKRILFSSTTPLRALHPDYRDLTPTFASGRSRWGMHMSLERIRTTEVIRETFFGYDKSLNGMFSVLNWYRLLEARGRDDD